MKGRSLVAGLLLSAGLLSGCEEENPPLESELRAKAQAEQLAATHKKKEQKSKELPEQHMLSAAEVLLGLQKQSPQTSPEELKHRVRSMTNVSQSTKDSIIEELNRFPNEKIYTINSERVKKGPLGKMRHINHNLATLLGGKYADSIMLMYNKEAAEQLMQTMRTNTFQWLQYGRLEDTNVPHIYPALADFLVPSLQDFLADKPEIAQLVGTDQEVIIITRNPEKKHVIGYYRDGHIDIAQYMSAGVGRDLYEMDHRRKEKRRVHAYTPTGVFYTNYAKGYKRDSTYYSKAFVSAMPYAIPISDNPQQWNGVALHTGLADGRARSHQCNRLPGWLAMYMFDQIGDRQVKVVIHDLYDPKISKKK